MYIKIPNKYIRKLLDLICEFSKTAKNTIYKSIKNSKYLRINLIKDMQDLYRKNSKSFLGEIKKTKINKEIYHERIH